ncbi:hypothetical protein K7459_12820 [Pseudomonas fluorescens]|uniref:Uncharacterized protein n=1 Tax=Pseudomonas fluorescens (strain Pf0-1) TaxID=205922 RepID=Q3KAH5_PSEPF|nr:hypothetical protein [Pseudomonas fluorescens]ABA75229.1 hypothetical protein Pfl01_3491 [Pseudomonas fluorescens Pf0-1]MBY9024549.1 hypothetical protein [Pseudomonas fluorescens]MBY9030936.1 hypothetical protein [Pseudomonas fluorescens]MBY9036939.1 hypothetical protein [Pseudomonas fluorescens]MBY9043045.1 hypothetical protein [Pseudomonas fluorescens]
MSITEYAQESISLLTPFVAPLAIVREDGLSNEQFALVDAVDAFLGAFEGAVESLAKERSSFILEACMEAVEEALEILTGQMDFFNVDTRVATSSTVIFDNTRINPIPEYKENK